jgi:glycosyltransferase involved in cell wall biosynthesis
MISVIIPVYHNEKALLKSLSFIVDKFSEIVVVFDGYKPDLELFNDPDLTNVKLIMNYPDVPWGNARARNIGAINSSNPYLLFLDCDHTFKNLFIEDEFSFINPGKAYRFKRTYNNKTTWPSGSLIMHRDMFFIVGGYNERFCGNYGYEDLYMVWKLREANHIVENSNIHIDVIHEGRTNLKRDTTINKKLFEELTK